MPLMRTKSESKGYEPTVSFQKLKLSATAMETIKTPTTTNTHPTKEVKPTVSDITVLTEKTGISVFLVGYPINCNCFYYGCLNCYILYLNSDFRPKL